MGDTCEIDEVSFLRTISIVAVVLRFEPGRLHRKGLIRMQARAVVR
jgi:hypothetical protein